MSHALRTVDSPLGAIALVADEQALVAVYLPAQAPPPAPRGSAASRARVDQAARQLIAYFAGDLRRFTVPLAPQGTAFQQRVWAELRRLRFGDRATYGELGRRLGQPSAARAVGSANGKNPIAIFIPCHRVVAAGGKLGGYASGLAAKRWLLEHESKPTLASPKAAPVRR